MADTSLDLDALQRAVDGLRTQQQSVQRVCGTCQAGLPFALFVGRPLNRGWADVVLLVPFL